MSESPSAIFEANFWECYAASCFPEWSVKPAEEEREVEEVFRALMKVSAAVERAGLSLASNETLEEASNEQLKFLSLPFVLGDLVNLEADDMDPADRPGYMKKRLERIRKARFFWKVFKCSMQQVGLLEEEVEFDEEDQERSHKKASVQDAMRQRERKIAQARQAREWDSSIAGFVVAGVHRGGPEGEEDGEHEDRLREMWLTILQRLVVKCCNEDRILEEEAGMLFDMLKRFEQGQTFNDILQESAPPEGEKQAWMVPVKNQTELRKLFQSMVFQPDFAQPTMTLDEFAEQEMADLRRREKDKARIMAQKGVVKTFSDDGYDSDDKEENEVEMYGEEEAEKKKRDWDDWKDENPRGAGNKMGNIG